MLCRVCTHILLVSKTVLHCLPRPKNDAQAWPDEKQDWRRVGFMLWLPNFIGHGSWWLA